MTDIFYGASEVARWCGVSNAAVSNWITRHPDSYPREDMQMITGRQLIRGWRQSRRAEWEQFAARQYLRVAASLTLSLGSFTSENLRVLHDFFNARDQGAGGAQWHDATAAVAAEISRRKENHEELICP